MNLVQINERLKEMPVQALQQYANGSNPMVPPYLALGEIQRREKAKQMMANDQSAGPKPSVKEQIEQAAGLMGLQQAQAQQQQAQQMQPRPGPVPEGAPQPEMQPEPEMMASGGIARIPMRQDLYRFANGGIIAFEEGGAAPQVITIPRGTSDEEIDRIRRENPDAILRPEANISPVPTQAQAAAPAPQASQFGSKASERSPLMAKALEAAEQMPDKPTAESTVAGINALLPQELQDAARQQRAAEAKQRREEAAKAYEGSKPSGLDQLIKVFGQAGQYKGLSGLGPAYTQNREQETAREAAFRREQEAMRSKAEEQQLKEAEGLFGARAKDYSGQMEGYRKQLASRSEALAGLAGADQRSIDAALGRMNDTELTKLRIAADRANAMRPGAGERMTAQILALRAKGDPESLKKADEMLEVYAKVSGSGTAGVGGERNKITALKAAMAGYKEIMDNSADDAERKDAQANYVRLTKQLAQIEEGGATARPTTAEEYAKLPKGATYTAPDGTTRTKG